MAPINREVFALVRKTRVVSATEAARMARCYWGFEGMRELRVAGKRVNDPKRTRTQWDPREETEEEDDEVCASDERDDERELLTDHDSWHFPYGHRFCEAA